MEKIPFRQKFFRSFVVFIGNSIGLFLIAQLNMGVRVSSFEDAFVIAFLVGIVNALLWPILTRILMPFLVFTFGIGSLVLNGFILEFFSSHSGAFEIEGVGIILAPLSMAAITTLISYILTVEDDANYYRLVLKRANKKRKKPVKDYPGVIIIEIDGLAHEVLLEAIDKGYMNFTKSLVNNSHILRQWETDLSSQTGASQAGILHGNNEDISAFRWVEKVNNNQIMQCSGVGKVKILEKRISDGNGLLAKDGASRSNLFSGDTDNVIFTFSKITNIKRIYNGAWFSVFSNPSNFARIVILFIYEMFLEIISQFRHEILNIRPRIKRGISYIPVRAGTNVFMREINTATLIGDILIGEIDVAYSTYLGYDEIAHHSGVYDKDSLVALKSMDKQIQRLFEASKLSPRKYQFVIQSDHGQSNGATFKQRNGQSFEEFVKSLLPENISFYANMSSNEDHNSEAFIPFYNQVNNFKNKHTGSDEDNSDVVVLASGNLALIYFTQWTHRLSYEEINEKFPKLISGIINNKYIGFIVVRSLHDGDLAISRDGIYYLDSDFFEGENPLDGFGENIVRHIKRNSSFKYTPDILVNSFYDEENNEVAAFEELVGSHGGVGGTQSKPFILYPASWNVSDEDIIGAEEIYKILKLNINNLKNQ